jgi:hypothetical protein
MNALHRSKPRGPDVTGIGVEHSLATTRDEPLQILVTQSPGIRRTETVVVTPGESEMKNIAPVPAVIVEETEMDVVTPIG